MEGTTCGSGPNYIPSPSPPPPMLCFPLSQYATVIFTPQSSLMHSFPFIFTPFAFILPFN
jgi:hypothetical protein